MESVEDQANSGPIEANPELLGRMFIVNVAAHLEGLEKSAQETGIVINDEQWGHLFRQVCLFYDALWYCILLKRIIEIRKIAPDEASLYVNTLRQKIMEEIREEESFRDYWRFWDASQQDVEGDISLYMNGVIPEQCVEDFQKILNATQVKRDGSILELIARLHMRTYQILGLFPKLDPMGMLIWWNRQAHYALGVAEIMTSKIIPTL